MPITDRDAVHFIGLGGIGMSALARILLQKGVAVQGSDAKPSALIDALRTQGAKVHIGHRSESLNGATYVIYSTDIKASNIELSAAKEKGLPLLHRSELLHALMEGKKPLLVTGTHGKTTTTALLASVLEAGCLSPSFVIGGIHQNFQSNGKWGQGPYFIAEADESDGSFLRTPSFGAIVTNLEDDHLDHWKSSEALTRGFEEFFRKAQHPEHLFWCGDDARLKRLLPQGVSYGFSGTCALRISNFIASAEGISFTIEWKGKRYTDLRLWLHGRHNALNAAAVFGLGLSLGVEESAIRQAFQEFAGVARRLEHKGTVHAVDVLDDYAHHPTELVATLRALRERIHERRLVAVFQPHRFTRVRDLFDQFVESLDAADVVVLTDIFSAGEAPIEGVTTEALLAKMAARYGAKFHYVARSELEAYVADHLMPHDVVVTLGAGDVTKAGPVILSRFGARSPRLKTAVLFGGTSAEHPVSVRSARNIAESLNPVLYDVALFGVTTQGHWIHGPDALDRLAAGYQVQSGGPKLPANILELLASCDVAIPAFHGPQGEDGMMQGVLDALQVPYAGCDYRSGALCMHKGWTKQVAVANGVPTAPWLEIDAPSFAQGSDAFIARVESEIRYPVWVKPVHLGSSIGVSRAANREELFRALQLSFSYDDVTLVEKEVVGRQIEYGMLGNEWVRVAMACEVLNEGTFYDYHKKYTPGACGYAIPARISDVEARLGEEFARTMYHKSGCKGLARIDFFLDESGQFWMNEINPFPGCTNTSAYPQMWKETGLSLSAIADALVILALQRSRALSAVRGKQ